MHVEKLLNVMTPDLYERFKRAIELRKWPDGNTVSPTQLETCLQMIIAYEAKNLPPQERTGYVPPKSSACGSGNGSELGANETQPLNWQD